MNIALGWLRTPFAKLLCAILGVLLAATMGFYWFELRNNNMLHGPLSALWWSVVTLTTVGYGDIVPQTAGGRVMGILVMLCGIGLVSTFTGNLASLLVERKTKKRKGLLEVRLNDHIVILGWNAFALNLVQALVQDGVLDGRSLVLVNTLGEEARNEIAYSLNLGERLHFVYGSGAQKSVVHKARPQEARTAFLLCQESMDPAEADQQTIYTALTLRSLAPKLPIFGEVALPDNREHLLRAGVNELLVRGEIATRVLGLMGKDPALWTLMQTMFGVRGNKLLELRPLTPDERTLNWRAFFERCREQEGSLPLALCKNSREISLQDLLDESSALDAFILELFESSGRDTRMGAQGPGVTANPADSEPLASYDSVLYLKTRGAKA
ncbi:MAG: potassium channel family protein [Desulfovibrio sp.]